MGGPYSWLIVTFGGFHSKILLLDSLTLFPHAHLEALSQAAVLALVPVVLVDRAAPGAAALICQVPPHRPLEEALAAWRMSHWY